MPAPTPTPKPLPAKPAQAATSETWFIRLIYAGTGREWVFSCDAATADELRKAMLDGRPAHLKYGGTEAIVNPAHVATVEFGKQE